MSSTSFLVGSLSNTLESNMLEELQVEKFVHTPIVEGLKVRLTSTKARSQTLVCGPRGVGKSTAVYKAMEGEKGVVHVALSPCSLQNLYGSMLTTLRFKHENIDGKTLIMQALEDIRKRRGNKPTFIVEVNEKCGEQELTQLLLELKDLGSDRNLAKFIVILSTSQAALLVSISLDELRVVCESVEDPSEDIIEQHLRKYLVHFSKDLVSEKQVDKLISHYIKVIGTRFLDSTRLIERWERAKCTTFDEVENICSKFITSRGKAYSDSLEEFTNKFNNKMILEALLSDKLQLREVCSAFNLTRKQFLEMVSEYNPHPVYIDPETSQVRIGNTIAERELKKTGSNVA